MNLISRLNSGLGIIILVSMLIFCCALGSYAAYVAMIAALLGLIVAFNPAVMQQLLRENWLQMWLLAFALIAIAFAVTAASTKDALYAFDFTQLLLALPVAMIFTKMARTNAIQLISQLSLLGTAFTLAVALYAAYVLDMSRVSGLENSTIHFAYFALILGFLSLARFFQSDTPTPWIYLLGPIMGFWAALITGTRGAVLVLGAVSLILMIFFIKTIKIDWRLKLLLVLGAFAAAALTIYGAYMVGLGRAFVSLVGVAQAMQGDQIADASTAYRIEHLIGGWQAFADAPWFGHGWVNQLASALPYMSEFSQAGYAKENWAYLHNEALSLAVSAGALGIAAYVLIFAAPLVGILRSPRDSQFVARSYGILIVTGGMVAGGLSEVLFKYEMPKTFFVTIIVALLVFCRDRQPTDGAN